MEEEVPSPSRHKMVAAMATLRKGIFFRDVDEWSLFSKLDDAVERATKKELKQSKIEDFLALHFRLYSVILRHSTFF